jgi:hypothetical protein
MEQRQLSQNLSPVQDAPVVDKDVTNVAAIVVVNPKHHALA